MEPVTWETFCLSTWRPTWGPMNFTPIAANSRIDRGDDNLSKTITFGPFLRLTFPCNDPGIKLLNSSSYLNTKFHLNYKISNIIRNLLYKQFDDVKYLSWSSGQNHILKVSALWLGILSKCIKTSNFFCHSDDKCRWPCCSD